IQIDYDPSQISYNDLLDIFWRNHAPSSRAWSKQYMAAVFYHNDEQKKLAEESREREASRQEKRIQTQILPFTAFYRAEDYHQKYRLRRERNLLQEFERIYPKADDLADSTAAARVNGYLGGFGTSADLKADLNRLGLSAEGSRYLLRIVESKNP
ncbi:MAG: peptide-methionine (S)-S-oxide reductase, partial [Desulfobacterales bacterium]